MIGMLVGKVVSVDSHAALIVVSGIGYETYMPSTDLSSLRDGQEVTVYTSLQVSQDSLTLYGFTSQSAKKMFLQVQKVSGIGPKVALSLLSTLNVDRLLKAIEEGNISELSSAPGLGKKGAQKIILELKGSIDIDSMHDSDSTSRRNAVDSSMQSIVDGLMSLGWKQSDAQYAVNSVCERYDIALPISESDVPKVLRMALTALDRGK